ncbi:subtilisin-like protease SBT5.3 [Arachis stenosperma]|uniref:subtilisin-like protease SBT5.3 n=1 Tax=Arachis stenosperma TaxID=217475 RepID=UPI0025AD08E7|nr:subtilisin-like protease SBT5.3 [Arachis stenosperma]
MRVPSSVLCYFLPLLLACCAAKKSYVVYMGAHSHDPTQLSPLHFNRVSHSHHQFLQSFLESYDAAKESIFYSYTRHINGFAAILEEEVAAEIAKHPKVISVFENRERKLHTTRSWEFMGLEQNGEVTWNSIWKKARYGEGVIIGNLDTGVWPESESFNEKGFGPIPSKWRGICDHGSDPTFHCNRKLIGARYFSKGFLSLAGKVNGSTEEDFESPRDIEGHGSHTLSTAAGNMVAGVSVFGHGYGTAKGGSPKARVATYKVCFAGGGCSDADMMAAFDMAIHDGVDVLSVSIGGPPSAYFNDSISIGSFHAAMNGIVVVCSAGNSGPFDASVVNLAPWHITVAASTMDRAFASYVVLGNNITIKGESLSASKMAHKFYPIIKAVDAKLASAKVINAVLCLNGTLDPKKVKGKIVLCLRGSSSRAEKGEEALLAGAVGMVLANDKIDGNEILADPHLLPASHVNFTDGLTIFDYINSTKFPMAYITYPKTLLHTKPAPFMASFSSKGPNILVPEILKPDITAPGVSVIAAYTEAQGPTNEKFDKRRIPYNSLSGTSMSCPHISGIVGLLKTMYPSWSPAAIKSAIMTTATTLDNEAEPLLNAANRKATPFSYGAGHVDPNSAMDPGLVYDTTIDDYLNFLCGLGYHEKQLSMFTEGHHYKCATNFSILNLNYPSITVPEFPGSLTLTRTLKNVGAPATYIAQVQNPRGITVSVKPNILEFKEVGEEKMFEVTLKGRQGEARNNHFKFGRLIWSDGNHFVKSPIVVKSN